jgi:YjbE family integral membrane protein
MFELADVWKFASVIWLDLVLSGDNALVIGLAASTLPEKSRQWAIGFGLVLATVVRILCAVAATFLLSIPGIVLIGGLALLWVAYRLWRELRSGGDDAENAHATIKPATTLTSALISITIADVSMSIDNVLAVAAIARDDVTILVFGLVLSIALMAVAATMIMRLMLRYPWISYVGVALLVAIGCSMVYEGTMTLLH